MNLALFKKSLDDINVEIGTYCEANILICYKGLMEQDILTPR